MNLATLPTSPATLGTQDDDMTFQPMLSPAVQARAASFGSPLTLNLSDTAIACLLASIIPLADCAGIGCSPT